MTEINDNLMQTDGENLVDQEQFGGEGNSGSNCVKTQTAGEISEMFDDEYIQKLISEGKIILNKNAENYKSQLETLKAILKKITLFDELFENGFYLDMEKAIKSREYEENIMYIFKNNNKIDIFRDSISSICEFYELIDFDEKEKADSKSISNPQLLELFKLIYNIRGNGLVTNIIQFINVSGKPFNISNYKAVHKLFENIDYNGKAKINRILDLYLNFDEKLKEHNCSFDKNDIEFLKDGLSKYICIYGFLGNSQFDFIEGLLTEGEKKGYRSSYQIMMENPEFMFDYFHAVFDNSFEDMESDRNSFIDILKKVGELDIDQKIKNWFFLNWREFLRNNESIKFLDFQYSISDIDKHNISVEWKYLDDKQDYNKLFEALGEDDFEDSYVRWLYDLHHGDEGVYFKQIRIICDYFDIDLYESADNIEITENNWQGFLAIYMINNNGSSLKEIFEDEEILDIGEFVDTNRDKFYDVIKNRLIKYLKSIDENGDDLSTHEIEIIAKISSEGLGGNTYLENLSNFIYTFWLFRNGIEYSEIKKYNIIGDLLELINKYSELGKSEFKNLLLIVSDYLNFSNDSDFDWNIVGSLVNSYRNLVCNLSKKQFKNINKELIGLIYADFVLMDKRVNYNLVSEKEVEDGLEEMIMTIYEEDYKEFRDDLDECRYLIIKRLYEKFDLTDDVEYDIIRYSNLDEDYDIEVDLELGSLKSVILLHVALKKFNNRILEYKDKIDEFVDKISNAKKEQIGELIRQETKNYQQRILEKFRSELGILKIPDNIGEEQLNIINSFLIYYTNITKSSDTDEDERNKNLIVLYLALHLNGLWIDFRSGKEIDLRKLVASSVLDGINSSLEDSDDSEINSIDNYLEINSLKTLGIEGFTQRDFEQLQKSEIGSYIGKVDSIDTKLLTIQDIIEKTLSDVDMYRGSGEVEQGIFSTFSHMKDPLGVGKKILTLLSKKYRELDGRQVEYDDFELEIINFHETISTIQEMNNPKYSDENIDMQELIVIGFLGPLTDGFTDKKKILDVQKAISKVNMIQQLPEFVRKINIESKIDELNELILPNDNLIKIFGKLGEKLTSNSGVIPVQTDVKYLNRLVEKNKGQLSKGEHEEVMKFINKVDEHIKSLYDLLGKIYEKTEDLFSSLEKMGFDQIVLNRFEEIQKQVRKARVDNDIEIVSEFTNDLTTVINHIRECLSCKQNEINNDTNLSFADFRRSFIVSHAPNSKHSFADQLVGIHKSDEGVVIAMDRLYGAKSFNVFYAHLNLIIKKLSKLDSKEIKIFIPNGVLEDSNIDKNELLVNLQKDNGVEENDVVTDVKDVDQLNEKLEWEELVTDENIDEKSPKLECDYLTVDTNQRVYVDIEKPLIGDGYYEYDGEEILRDVEDEYELRGVLISFN